MTICVKLASSLVTSTGRHIFTARSRTLFVKCYSLQLRTVMTPSVQEQKANVAGVKLNYVKVGNGPHAVLCLPGALGSIWTDFQPQVEKLNREKFTVVAWDPPGYGRSRPPDRQFPDDFFHQDAKYAAELMQALDFKKFSLLGWSDGGITATILAAKYPSLVQKLVVWGSNAYIIKEELEIYEKIRDISNWSERMRAPMIALYGEEYFRKTWSDWVDAFLRLYHTHNGDICKGELAKITCPTFIIHGKKDAMVANEHPHYLHKNIKNSRLHVMEEGKHNLHVKYADDFNKLVEDFLTE